MHLFISIIVPVFNADNYLSECIDSILRQDFIDFELLLIDDGSNDDSAKICDNYKLADSRIIVIHQKNQGVSVARNVGLDHAKGEYILFVDADDIMLPDSLSIMCKHMDSSNADVALASSKVLAKGKLLPYHVYHSGFTNDAMGCMSHPALWGYVFRKSVIREHHIRFIPGLAYSEDRVFLANYGMYAKNMVLISDFVYIYRRNDSSACAKVDGVLKSYHQFRAAVMLIDMGKEVSDKRILSILYKKKKEILKMGYMSYALNSFSLKSYPEYERNYLKFFDCRFCLLCHTLWAWLTCQRRKIVTFKSNPLVGES